MSGLGTRTGECQQQSRFGSPNHALVPLSTRKQLTASCDPCCSPLAACSTHSSNMAAVRRLTGAGMARDCTACHLETRRRSRCKLLDEALKLPPPPLNTANHHATHQTQQTDIKTRLNQDPTVTILEAPSSPQGLQSTHRAASSAVQMPLVDRQTNTRC